MIQEKSLLIRKETQFDKIRKTIYQIFFKQEYLLELELERLLQVNRPNSAKIVIPKEIKL